MSSQVDTKVAAAWARLRSAGASRGHEPLIFATAPEGVQITSVTHLRTAHYAAYRVDDSSGHSWVVRLGVVSPQDDATADNTGYLGTSSFSPSGQLREAMIAAGFQSAGADVCKPERYRRTTDGHEALWLSFVDAVDKPITASMWHRVLTDLHQYAPTTDMPVFTNRAKTFARLDELPSIVSNVLKPRYDSELEELFNAATQWSVIHGDAHAGNAMNTGDSARLFDFDTACWAPSVWDITHLLNRAGKGQDCGYTAPELRSLFTFDDREIDAALALRRTAALVAATHREYQPQS